MKKLLALAAALLVSTCAFAQRGDTDFQVYFGESYLTTEVKDYDFYSQDSFTLGFQNYNYFGKYFGFAERLSWGNGFEIAFGPAGRIPVSDNFNIRGFVGLHFADYGEGEFISDSGDYELVSDHTALGVAIDFQAKMTVTRRCSPIVGFKLDFDPLVLKTCRLRTTTFNEEYEPEYKYVKSTINYDLFIAPYIAIAFNF